MARKIPFSLVALVAGTAAGVIAARKIAYAPPDPQVEARADADAHRGPWTHGYAEVRGLRLHYAEIGEGPLVILLHGFPECWYTWHNILPRLGTRFHVVAPDMRGYNWSSKPGGVDAYTMEEVARDIEALIEHFGEARAHVVGHDWGGEVAWQLGMQHPECVNRLVAINAPHPAAVVRSFTKPEQQLRSSYVYFFQLPVVPEAVVRLLLRLALPATAVVPGAFPEEALDVYQNGVSQPGAATAMLNYYRATARSAVYRLQVRYPAIGVPTMVIWGMKDFALGPYLLDSLDEWVPGVRIERVEDSGHWVPEEKPRVVTDLLIDFLA